jgi:hypothetical protein
MTPISSHGSTRLRDAMYELSMAKPVPDATLLDHVVMRFPEHASVLTEFAIELALDTLRGDAAIDEAEASVDLEKVSPAVSRAMSRFQNRLHAVERSVGQTKARAASGPVEPPNPFSGLSRQEHRALAERLGANAAFVNKLRDRQIEPGTVPAGFQRFLAGELNAPFEVVVAHLAAPSALGTANRQFLKADRKPDGSLRQTFAEAVQSSGLSDEQQQRLLRR